MEGEVKRREIGLHRFSCQSYPLVRNDIKLFCFITVADKHIGDMYMHVYNYASEFAIIVLVYSDIATILTSSFRKSFTVHIAYS